MASNNESTTSSPKSSHCRSKQAVDLGNGSEVIYIPRFVAFDQAWDWFHYLDKQMPWTRPSIRVFGRTCLQPRETCYVAEEGLAAMQYSGHQPHAYSWDDYPVLKDILKSIHEVLPGSSFNSVLLNRYTNGTDYVAWHSDEDKLYGPTPDIASVTFGCEREFLLRKKPIKMPKGIYHFQVEKVARCSTADPEDGQAKTRSTFIRSKTRIFVVDERLHPERLVALSTEACESRFG